MLFFFISLIFSLGKQPLMDFIIGEWDVYGNKMDQIRDRNSSLYSVALNRNMSTNFIECSIWNNTVDLRNPAKIDNFEVAQLEVEFLTEYTGRIFSYSNKRNFMTDFSFDQSNFGLILSTKGKINKHYSFQLSLMNGTFFQLLITSTKSSEVKQFFAFRAIKAPIPKSGTGLSLILYVGVIIVLLQAVLWISLKCCKSSMDKKLAFAQENSIIDLDKYSEMMQRKKEKKD